MDASTISPSTITTTGIPRKRGHSRRRRECSPSTTLTHHTNNNSSEDEHGSNSCSSSWDETGSHASSASLMSFGSSSSTSSSMGGQQHSEPMRTTPKRKTSSSALMMTMTPTLPPPARSTSPSRRRTKSMSGGSSSSASSSSCCASWRLYWWMLVSASVGFLGFLGVELHFHPPNMAQSVRQPTMASSPLQQQPPPPPFRVTPSQSSSLSSSAVPPRRTTGTTTLGTASLSLVGAVNHTNSSTTTTPATTANTTTTPTAAEENVNHPLANDAPPPTTTQESEPQKPTFGYYRNPEHDDSIVHVIHTYLPLEEEKRGPSNKEGGNHNSRDSSTNGHTDRDRDSHTTTTHDNNNNDDHEEDWSYWQEAQLQVFEHVTLASLEKQTSSFFLYVVWIPRCCDTLAEEDEDDDHHHHHHHENKEPADSFPHQDPSLDHRQQSDDDDDDHHQKPKQQPQSIPLTPLQQRVVELLQKSKLSRQVVLLQVPKEPTSQGSFPMDTDIRSPWFEQQLQKEQDAFHLGDDDDNDNDKDKHNHHDQDQKTAVTNSLLLSSSSSSSWILAGSVEQVSEYHVAAQSRVTLNTILEHTDGLFKDFVATVQRQAAESKLTTTGTTSLAATSSSSSSLPPPPPPQHPTRFQIWCSNVYLEWRAEPPTAWLYAKASQSTSPQAAAAKAKKKKTNKRGMVQGQLQLQNTHQGQCDFASGLTIAYAPYSPPITFTVPQGLVSPPLYALQDEENQGGTNNAAAALGWMWSWLPPELRPQLSILDSNSNKNNKVSDPNHPNGATTSTAPGHLPRCEERDRRATTFHGRPYNCLRYIDVGVFEYGVLRTITYLQDDWTRLNVEERIVEKPQEEDDERIIRTRRKNNKKEETERHGRQLQAAVSSSVVVSVDPAWRKLQDPTFGVLGSRFGVPQAMFSQHIKPLFQGESRHALIRVQYQRHLKQCGSGSTSSSTSSTTTAAAISAPSLQLLLGTATSTGTPTDLNRNHDNPITAATTKDGTSTVGTQEHSAVEPHSSHDDSVEKPEDFRLVSTPTARSSGSGSSSGALSSWLWDPLFLGGFGGSGSGDNHHSSQPHCQHDHLVVVQQMYDQVLEETHDTGLIQKLVQQGVLRRSSSSVATTTKTTTTSPKAKAIIEPTQVVDKAQVKEQLTPPREPLPDPQVTSSKFDQAPKEDQSGDRNDQVQDETIPNIDTTVEAATVTTEKEAEGKEEEGTTRVEEAETGNNAIPTESEEDGSIQANEKEDGKVHTEANVSDDNDDDDDKKSSKPENGVVDDHDSDDDDDDDDDDDETMHKHGDEAVSEPESAPHTTVDVEPVVPVVPLAFSHNSSTSRTTEPAPVVVQPWTKWRNRHGLVHVVHSRFMQHQAQLINLGKARIDLFRTFCAPSMRYQTNQEYLWMIWTDPSLNQKLLQDLADAVRDFPNVVIVGNTNLVNQDFRQSMNGLLSTTTTTTAAAGGGSTAAEAIKSLLDDSSILHGSRELLLDYYEASQQRILLETRLDADDALSGNFLETVQAEATASISRLDKTDYRVWCANRYVDWRYYSPSEEMASKSLNGNANGDHGRSHKGFLSPEEDLQGCVTVGLTMGFQTKASVDQLPTKEHHRIREGLPSCNKTNKRCVRGLLPPPEQQFLALRARTPTSTSMINVVSSSTLDAALATGDNGVRLSVEEQQQLMWASMERDFDIRANSVWELRDRFQQNLPDILLDAIAGLCKAGHSCRQSSKAMLTKLLKEAVANAASESANTNHNNQVSFMQTTPTSMNRQRQLRERSIATTTNQVSFMQTAPTSMNRQRQLRERSSATTTTTSTRQMPFVGPFLRSSPKVRKRPKA
ncbi:hypothetical protein ACA910_010867 [Epithemia clementina (nom. ined.)]